MTEETESSAQTRSPEPRDEQGTRFRLMPKTRFEAFSDGVLVIVITILVLELAVPEESENLLEARGEQWASYLGYVVSFVFVGGIWLAHADVSRLEELGLVERSEDGSISVPFESVEIRLPLAQVA